MKAKNISFGLYWRDYGVNMEIKRQIIKNTNVFVPVDNFNSGGGDLDYSIRQRKRK